MTVFVNDTTNDTVNDTVREVVHLDVDKTLKITENHDISSFSDKTRIITVWQFWLASVGIMSTLIGYFINISWKSRKLDILTGLTGERLEINTENSSKTVIFMRNEGLNTVKPVKFS